MHRNMRTLLAAWAPGEVRDLYVAGCRKRSKDGVCYGDVDRAISLKALVRLPGGGRVYNGPERFRRTDVEVKPPRPQRRNANYGRTHPFPWPVDEHWQRIESSKARAIRGIAKALGAADDYALAFSYPQMCNTKAELRDVRGFLLRQFGTAKQHRCGPTNLVWYTVTGVSIHLLFMELLVRPVFAAGRFVRFEEISDAYAVAERERLAPAAQNFVNRYKQFVTTLP